MTMIVAGLTSTLELVCPPEAALALSRHPALGRPKGARARYRRVQRTWHDTPEGTLADSDRVLAEVGPSWEMESLGLSWPRGPGMPGATIAAAPHPAELEIVLGQILPGPLRPVASFNGRLQRLIVSHEGTELECRITTGTLIAINADGDDVENRPVGRVEIEGPLDAALSLARALAADFPLTPSLITLPHEARLLGGAKLKLRPSPALTPDTPTEEALAILISGVIGTFLLRLSQIPARKGAEPVHQARVTLRRLRALTLAFRPILREAEADIKPALADLKAVLGPARDWDVFLSETVTPLSGGLDHADAATEWLRQAATTRREEAYAALTEWLAGPAFRDLALRLVGLCLGSGWHHLTATAPALPGTAEAPAAGPTYAATIGPFALKCIESRWKKTARPTKELAELPAAEIHMLRIKCKKLRYQAEMFSDVLPGKSGKRLVARLAEAQESMGLLNDGTVATDLVRSLRPHAHVNEAERHLAAEAIGLIRGHGVAHARDSREAVLQSWRKLVKQSPF
jgi:triphosphatase